MSESQNQKSALFPTISQVATDTDALPDDDAPLNGKGGEGGEEEEEKQMQEIESLCMRCHEQVGQLLRQIQQGNREQQADW